MVFGDSPPFEYGAPFFSEEGFLQEVAKPDALLGFTLGSRLASHGEVRGAFRTWLGQTDRMRLSVYGRTHEGRELLAATVSSPANLARLDEIRDHIRALEDPRGLSEERAEAILADTPAVAWLGYSIHGDETSGTDASLAVAYRLLAGTDPQTLALLDDLVIVIDPCMNPDGRTRTVTQVQQNAGYVTNLDLFSRHRGHWPYGRGNHYLFDMNRDWIVGACPETRGRWKVARDLPPQLVVDAHEMGGFDTYLFYPQSKPLNPRLPGQLPSWQGRFASDQSRAFDERGWGYYTREWADAWFPGYSDAWGSLNGAIGLLYEQASVSGQPLARPSGRIVSYRESVHGHVVSSLVNLETLAANRREILADFLAFHREQVDGEREDADEVFVLVPGRVPDRELDLLELLVSQGIEVREAQSDFELMGVQSALLETEARRKFAAGSYVIQARQPRSALLHSVLDFDPRMDEESLQRERESLERKGQSRIYDITAWDYGRAFAVDCFWGRTESELVGDSFPVVTEPVRRGRGIVGDVSSSANQDRAYAYVVDGREDRSVAFAAHAMQLGLAVHIADKAFTTAGKGFVRGSLLLRRHENEGREFGSLVQRAAEAAGVQAVTTSTGRSPNEGPDLGGGHFDLLERPRIAVVAGHPVRADGYGHLWHLLDTRLGVPFSILEAHELGSYDLRRYNVLLLPPAPASRMGAVLAEAGEALADWIDAGGVLIACGDAAVGVVDYSELSSVALRRNSLDELDAYAFAAKREADARDVALDLGALWGETPVGSPTTESPAAKGKPKAPEHDLELWEPWARRFAPAGAILKGLVDTEHWLTFGSQPEMPVPFSGAHVLMSRDPVRTPIRLAAESELRLAGVLWPEARQRLQHSAWVTCERRGRGAVVLFASPPAFRGLFRGSARLLSNAVVYGPGLAASAIGRW